MKESRDEYGRRPLTERERTQLLDLPLTGIYSTLSIDDRIHSVPVITSRWEENFASLPGRSP